MRIFIDTNILIDFMAARQPYYQAAAALFSLAELKEIELVYSSLSVINTFYILRKNVDRTQLSEAFENQKSIVEIVGISSSDIYSALAVRWPDVEDSIQHQSAISSMCDCILTRNIQDYSRSIIPVMSPIDFLDQYYDNNQS